MAPSSSGTAMADWSTTDDYLAGEETLRRRELLWGVVREPPAPLFGHQAIVTRLAVLFDGYVRPRKLGCVVVSPIDVVLDPDRALIVQPDLVFLSTERIALVRGQIWGAPDLVVEVLSPGTERRDRHAKLGWYKRYGVRECWLVDPFSALVIVYSFARRSRARTYRTGSLVQSAVVPGFALSVDDVFSL